MKNPFAHLFPAQLNQSSATSATSKTETLTIKIGGMHCTSCSLNIDGELEDTPGVISAKTSYAKSVTIVTFDQQKTTSKALLQVIQNLGYTTE